MNTKLKTSKIIVTMETAPILFGTALFPSFQYCLLFTLCCPQLQRQGGESRCYGYTDRGLCGKRWYSWGSTTPKPTDELQLILTEHAVWRREET